MSQWVPNPESLTPSEESAQDRTPTEEFNRVMAREDSGTQGPLNKPETPARIPWWVHVFPFCLSALFFLSAFLVVFSPLPLLFLHIRKGRAWAWLAGVTNGLIVGLLGGVLSLVFYLVWVITLAWVLPEMLIRKKSVEASAVWTIVIMAVAGMGFLAGYSHIHHLNPVLEVKNQISNFVDYLGQSVSVNSGLINPGDVEEWKHGLLLEFPSALAIFSLVLVWANITLLLRANPKGMRERLGLDANYLRSWKAPEFLVWPTILSGAFLVIDVGVASDVALNVFKFLMAIYAIQGLSVLSYFFDLWGVRGFFRLLGYSLSLFLMMPLVLSLGFFDLWFDFRGKFRQS